MSIEGQKFNRLLVLRAVGELGDLFRSGCWIPMNSESAA